MRNVGNEKKGGGKKRRRTSAFIYWLSNVFAAGGRLHLIARGRGRRNVTIKIKKDLCGPTERKAILQLCTLEKL